MLVFGHEFRTHGPLARLDGREGGGKGQWAALVRDERLAKEADTAASGNDGRRETVAICRQQLVEQRDPRTGMLYTAINFGRHVGWLDHGRDVISSEVRQAHSRARLAKAAGIEREEGARDRGQCLNGASRSASRRHRLIDRYPEHVPLLPGILQKAQSLHTKIPKRFRSAGTPTPARTRASHTGPDSADRGSEIYRQRRLKRSHQLMNSQDDGSFSTLSSPRGEQQQLLCKYKSGKCSNPRATKRNGQLHTLCHFHRDRQNEHQRKSDRKHRMVSVARRAKLGSIGVGSDSTRRHSLHSITSLEAAFPNGSSVSPLNRFGYDQNASDAFRNAQYATGGVPNGLGGLAPPPPVGTPRLPPISFLMPGKLDGYRATSAAMPNLPPSTFITDSLNGNAGKTA
ncbi:hypothetical protein GN958_ATG00110 [Phytophthora infestans]|uniref:Uncharacterized protein n=1 Tax=Phytophthora infestans TaxID=4787 RepID=A0A8S9VBG1_PHYIN|nr:hypothetical protein GN958_ATG00110 [Phytophthora infestans]